MPIKYLSIKQSKYIKKIKKWQKLPIKQAREESKMILIKHFSNSVDHNIAKKPKTP